ncbi:LamG-like jellyroll fold domain-containing protein [Kitasatospora phosalacinea]|uniref:LamG-like jellyroll fold domain-containing protein n=1 Tax=Kitasatospora phosalacinea TaxID=2065 RepID=UPI002552E21C|nr:LamG-like jellyroll fold domain-containing protein [Kitasatospora phosalacinea]
MSEQDRAEGLAVAEAKRTGKPVEVEALKSETSDVVAQPDGRLLSTTYLQTKRVRKAGRGWVDVDPTLAVLPSGAVAPKATTADVEFSGGGSGQPLVRMSQAGKELKLSWPKALPKPVLDGQTAEYRSILPDVDLKLTASATGFSQVLVVHTPEAAKNPELDALRLGLQGDGLTVKQESDGSLKAVDRAGGGTVFEAAPPVMWDSSTPAGPSAPPSAAAKAKSDAVPGEGAKMTRLKVDLPKGGMVLTPDQGMLDDPATVYPVMIDPQWNTPLANEWAGVSRTYPNQTYWHFTYTADYVHDWGVGYCGDTSRCAPLDVKRAFYQVPSGAFAGKEILKATFGTYESHAYSCNARPVELWWSGAISRGLTWNSQNNSAFWIRNIQTINDAKGYTGCADDWLEWGGDKDSGVKNLVQDAANGGWQTITFGLKAQNEGDAYGWKRFTDGAYLQVYYNLRPNQIAMPDMTMSPGSACQFDPVNVNRVPQVTVNRATDPDGDPIAVQFAVAWDTGDGLRRRWWSTGAENNTPGDFKASGSQFTYQLPDVFPHNTRVSWEARAWDGRSWGPWSSDGDPTACYFNVDTSVPAGPTVTSANYPGSTDATASLPWTDGVGRYASFTLKAAGTTVTKYQWALDNSPFTDLATTGGAAQTVKVLPQTPGLHVLSARAVNAAGTVSQPEAYYFNVLGGQGQRTGWGMDGNLNGSGAQVPLALGTGATPGAAGHLGSALTFNGDAQNGYAQTDAAVLDTSKSYTVSAWVKFDGTPNTRVAVSQNGPDYFSYTLGVGMAGGTDPHWSFKIQTNEAGADATSYSINSPTVAPTGRWTHLTGVYDKAANSIRLYVDGVSVGSALVPSSVWDGHGSVQIGRDRWSKLWSAPWAGSVDEVKMWDRALTPAEITQVAADQQLTTGTPAKAVWHLDESAAPVVGAPEADALTPFNGPQTNTTGITGQALHLDGTDDYLRTSRPQVDGTRDFSVSAWVKLPKLADSDNVARIAITQIGQHNSEFALYYSAGWKRWSFGRYKEDTTADTLVRTWQQDCTPGTMVGTVPCFAGNTGEWTHLIGVNDTTAKKTRLYINGYLVGESDYTQNSPWANPGPLQIGAVNREGANSEYFGGDIDDVRIYDRVVTTPEATAMVQQRPLLAGRWKLNAATSGATPDEGPSHLAATLGTGASINTGGGLLPTPGSLALNGSTGYAATSAAPLHTNQSFTLAGWANTAGIPTRDMTVLSLPGTDNSAVTMRWHSLGLDANGNPRGEWQAEVRTADANGAPRTLIAHTPQYSVWENWTHLALSYDSFSRRLVLYVNGQEENQTCEAGSADCVPHVSSAGAPQPYEASGSLQLGRNRAGGAWTEYFSGELDDIWLYQGVLSPAQLLKLADYNNELNTATGV